MRKLCFFITFSIYFIGFAQENLFVKPKTFPVAPNAYEFVKYEEIPVSKYTGVPNISIPIHTVESGANDLQIPITLTYHSNGFRVKEQAGWTGLGWTLNEGGIITQVVNGYDDFKTIHPNRELPDIDAIIFHGSNGYAPRDFFTSSGINYGGSFLELDDCHFNLPKKTATACGGSVQLLNLVPWPLFGLGERFDYEPDVFYFSFLGYSGKFVLDWETETFKCLTDPKIKITKSRNTHKEISITTPEGHIFEFSMKDETINCDNNLISYDLSEFEYGKGNESHKGVTSRIFKLDKIYTNRGNSILYSYTTTDFIYGISTKVKTHIEDPINWGTPTPPIDKTIKNPQTFTYVNRISSGLTSIEFEVSDRLDIVGAKKLDKIKVLRRGSSAGSKTIKQFNFNYSYFIGQADGLPNNIPSYKSTTEYTHRLKLNSVTELGKPPYVFTYNSTQLPTKYTFAKDYWGFYNGVLSNVNEFPNIFRFNYELKEFDIIFLNKANVSANNRSARLEYTKAGILEKITYPTGGITEFEYELNSFSNAIVPNFRDTENTQYVSNRINYGAGLRIKEIKNIDVNNIITKKRYTYEGGKLMTPVRFFNKVSLGKVSTPIFTGHNYSESWRRTLSISNFESPSINSNGNFVGYSQVTEHFTSNNDDLENSGHIKYIFENHEENLNCLDTNKALITESDWEISGKYLELGLPLFYSQKGKNGSLIEQHFIDKNGTLKKKIINTYGHKLSDFKTYGARVGGQLKKQAYPYTATGYATGFKVSYMLGAYSISGLYTFLDSTKEINYFDGNSVTTKTDFSYNNYNQIKEKRTIASNGDTIQVKAVYTSDMPLYVNDNFLNAISSNKVLKNGKYIKIIDYIYEKRSVPNNHPNYGAGNFYFKKKIINRLSNQEINFINDSFGNISHARIEGEADTYYVWGYGINRTRLIAKIENYIYSSSKVRAIVAAQNSSDWDNYMSTKSSEDDLRNKLTALRNAFPNAMVTTYTYDPLVGVTSITDPMGQTIYYHYDDFNRLEYVTDKDGKVLNKNEYHYKN